MESTEQKRRRGRPVLRSGSTQKERNAAANAEKYRANRVAIIARTRDWQRENPEKYKATQESYRINNKQGLSEYAKARLVNESPEARSERLAKNKLKYAENRDQVLARAKEKRDANRDVLNAKKRAWRADNPEKDAEVRRAWNNANRDKLSAYQKAWRAANPEKARLKDQTKHSVRRARKLGQDVENFRAIDVFERDGWRCYLCLKPVDRTAKWPDPASPTLDHETPISKGGGHMMDNVRCAHASCNMKKSDKPWHETAEMMK